MRSDVWFVNSQVHTDRAYAVTVNTFYVVTKVTYTRPYLDKHMYTEKNIHTHQHTGITNTRMHIHAHMCTHSHAHTKIPHAQTHIHAHRQNFPLVK